MFLDLPSNSERALAGTVVDSCQHGRPLQSHKLCGPLLVSRTGDAG